MPMMENYLYLCIGGICRRWYGLGFSSTMWQSHRGDFIETPHRAHEIVGALNSKHDLVKRKLENE